MSVNIQRMSDLIALVQSVCRPPGEPLKLSLLKKRNAARNDGRTESEKATERSGGVTRTEPELTREERSVIAALKRIGKRWPDTLWIYANGGSLLAMRKVAGHPVETSGPYGSPLQEDIVDTIEGISNDGGDF